MFDDLGNDIFSGVRWVPDAYDWLSSSKGDQSAKSDRNFINPYLNKGSPYVGDSPYKKDQNALIRMLHARANGEGPSIAGDAYKQAASDAQSRALTMSYGSSPGAGRAAIQQMGNVDQGLANGYSTARNQEMIGATGQLGGAIGQADSSQMLRDKANQEAWLKMMDERFGLTKSQMGDKTNTENVGGIAQGIGALVAML